MNWKYYLLIITLFIIVVACIPLFYRTDRNIAREWMSGYAGLLAIAAAILASVPVFQQLDEARLATKSIKIQLIVNAQRSHDEERARVDEVEKISEDAEIFHLLDRSNLFDRMNVWKIKSLNIYQEMTLKTDKPHFLYMARNNLAQSINVFLGKIKAFEDSGRTDKSVPGIEEAARDLLKVCQAYDEASHERIEEMHKKISDNEAELLQ